MCYCSCFCNYAVAIDFDTFFVWKHSVGRGRVNYKPVASILEVTSRSKSIFNIADYCSLYRIFMEFRHNSSGFEL